MAKISTIGVDCPLCGDKILLPVDVDSNLSHGGDSLNIKLTPRMEIFAEHFAEEHAREGTEEPE